MGAVSTALLSLVAVVTRLIAMRVALRLFVLGVSARKRDGGFVIALLQSSTIGTVRPGAMASSQAFEVLVVPFRARPGDR